MGLRRVTADQYCRRTGAAARSRRLPLAVVVALATAAAVGVLPAAAHASDGEVRPGQQVAAGTSQNGWPADRDPAAIDVRSFAIPGSSISLTMKAGDVSTVLLHVAERFNADVEPLRSDSYGYSYRFIAGTDVLSNHASGTALDLNANTHKHGDEDTFTPAQVATIREILEETQGVIRWGGDYTTTVDDMHFEINVPPGSQQLADAAADLRGVSATAASPTTIRYGDDIHVLATSRNHTLLWKSRVAGAGWSAWTDLGGQIAGDPRAVIRGSEIWVFAAGTDRNLRQRTWNPVGGWGQWVDHGGQLTGSPEAVGYGEQVNVFVTGTNAHVYQKEWTAGGWSAWIDLSGQITGSPAAVVHDKDLSIFVTGTGRGLHQRTWRPGSGWTGWSGHGGQITGSPEPVVAEQQITVFVTGTDTRVYLKEETAAGWSGWTSLGGAITGDPGAVVHGGQLSVFVTGTGRGLHQQTWSPGEGWTGWTGHGGQIIATPAPLSHDDVIDVFVNGVAGAMYQKQWSPPAGWSAWIAHGGALAT